MLSSKQSPESIYMALSMLDVAFPPIADNAILQSPESIYMALSMLDVAFPPIAVNAIYNHRNVFIWHCPCWM